MKFSLNGSFEGHPVALEWDDGQVHGDADLVGMIRRAAIVGRHEPFPTPDGFVKFDDWLSHPRGFVLCAEMFLKDVQADWVDEEMEDVILMR